MQHTILIDAYNPDLTIAACMEDDVITDVFCESESNADNVGNIYLAKVVNIVDSLSAYFVNYGVEKNGFLPFSSTPSQLKRDDYVIAQIAKNEKGGKGARLTGFIKLTGKYSILMPYGSFKNNAKNILQKVEHSNYKAIETDLEALKASWAKILTLANQKKSQLLYQKSNMISRILMNKYLHIPVNIIVDGIKVVEEIKKVVRELGINAQITEHKSMVPIFHKYGAANTIRNLSNNKVFLPSGGSIVIDHAEAMVCIDINSSSADEGDLSSNSHKVNMEAAEEIARQIRMRDLSGIIAIDFIDMNSSDKIAAVEGKFKEAIKLDTPLIKLAPINEFCVMLLSRPRSNLNLHEYLYTSCEHCGSRGFRKTMQNLVTNIFYEIRLSIATHHSPLVTVECESKVAFYILNQMRKVLVKLEESGSSIIIKSNEALINSFCVMPQGAYNIPKKLVDIPKKVVPVRHYLPQIHQIWPSPYISLMDDQGSIVISMH